MFKTIALAVLALSLPALAQEAAPKSKEQLASELAVKLFPQMVGKELDPAALYGAQICEDQASLASFEESRALELAAAKESGVVDMPTLHEAGHGIVEFKKRIKATRAEAAKYKVKPAPCSAPIVVKILDCGVCAVIDAEWEAVVAYSVRAKQKKLDAAKLEEVRALINAQSPDALARLDAQVDQVLKAVGAR